MTCRAAIFWGFCLAISSANESLRKEGIKNANGKAGVLNVTKLWE